MNLNFLSEEIGFYMPNMFFLSTSTERDFKDWRDWSDKELCTFLHEYVHFIQDISTAVGLYNIYTLGEVLAQLINNVYKLPKGEFRIPVRLVHKGDYVCENLYLLNSSWGATELPTPPIGDKLEIDGRADIKEYPLRHDLKHVICYKVNVPYKHGTFELGYYHIMESMAYLAEQIAYETKPKAVEPSPDYPYNVVEKLAMRYDPRLSRNKKFLFLICDYSLLFSYPAKALISIFEDYVQKGCPEDWRGYLIHRIKADKVLYEKDKQGTISDSLNAIKDLALRSLDIRFNTSGFYDIRQWYHTIIERAIELRLKKPLFMLDFIVCGELKTNKLFPLFLKAFGTPLITNSLKQTTIFAANGTKIDTGRAKLLVAAGGIINTLFNGNVDTSCPLSEYCHKSHVYRKNICEKAPWKSARRFCACPYGKMWFGWNLSMHIPIAH